MAQINTPPPRTFALKFALNFTLAVAACPLPAQAQSAVSALDSEARVQMSKGATSAAIDLMQQHLAQQPEDSAARIDLVKYLTWSGRYSAAQSTLLAHPQTAQSPQGQSAHINLLAWGGRWSEAHQMNIPLLSKKDEDFMPAYNQAIIFRQTYQPVLAQPYIHRVNILRPDSKEAFDLERGTWIKTASSVTFDYADENDSIDIGSRQPRLSANIALSQAWRITGQFANSQLSIANGSPYPYYPIVSGNSVTEQRGMLGVIYAPTPSIRTQFALGQSHLDKYSLNDRTTLIRASADLRSNDDWLWSLKAERDRVMVSPRSASLGIMRNGVELHTHYTPDLNWHVQNILRYDSINDDNRRQEWQLSIKRAAVRQPKWMLDLGAAWQQQHHKNQANNGYYAPDHYQRYSITASAYFNFSDNHGLSLQGGIGRQKDENFTTWKKANDISAELVLGIYSAWELRVRAAYSERFQKVGFYDARNYGVSLTHRF